MTKDRIASIRNLCKAIDYLVHEAETLGLQQVSQLLREASVKARTSARL